MKQREESKHRKLAALDMNTALPYSPTMYEFVETPLFSRMLERYLDDDDYAQLQAALNARPEAGAIVPGSGGVRKLRWGAEGRGKRGGLRVIYYLRTARGQIWMLTLYGKNVQENIPGHVLKRLREEIEDEEDV